MDTTRFLLDNSSAVIKRATDSVRQSRLMRTELGISDSGRLRMESMYFLVIRSLYQKNPDPLIGYIGNVARQRFLSGHGVDDIRTELDTLWEAIREETSAQMGPVEFAEVTTLVGRVLDKGKEALGFCQVKVIGAWPAHQRLTPGLVKHT